MNYNFSKNPFVLFTLVGVVGILLATFYLQFQLTLWIATSLLIFSIIFYFISVNKNFSNIILIFTLIFVAALRYNQVASLLPENHILLSDLSSIKQVTGVITETHFRKDGKHKYILSAVSKNQNNKSETVTGKILFTTSKIDNKFEYGDLIKINGEFKKPVGQRNPGAFDYRAYLESKDIYVISYIKSIDSISVIDKGQGNLFMQFVIDPIKQYCSKTLDGFLSEDNSGIMHALLLGEKQDIEKDLLERFKNVGVVHVLAISGLHVGFIMLFVFGFLSFFPFRYKTKVIILITFLLVYVVLINFKAPVLRASLMASLFLLGKLGERKVSIYNIVFSAAFIILLLEPRELFNPGFQFSFSAVLSIIYGYDKFDKLFPLKKYVIKRFPRNRLIQIFLKYTWMAFLVSLAVVLGTLPLTIYYYGIVPVFALFANVIVIPLIGLIVISGIFLLILAPLLDFLALGLGNFINMLFAVLKYLVTFFNELPYSYFDVSTPSLLMVVLLMILVYFIFNIPQRRSIIIIAGITALLFILHSSKSSNSENIEITFIDVGQGDASYIKFPNGESMLVDGGDASFGWDHGKNTIIPFLKYKGCSRLKYVVASHPHNDHIGGFVEVLKRIKVDTLVLSPYKFNTKIYKNILGICKEKNIQIRYVQRGDFLYPDSTCRIYVLHPTEEYAMPQSYDGAECNNSSIVLKIQYEENGILLTGDLETKAEKTLWSYAGFLESEILKVGHHGSKTSTSDKLLEQVKPLAGIVSVAEKNKFRHPSQKTINRLRNYFVKDYLTSKEGAVVFHIGTEDIKQINWRNNLISY